MIAKELSRCCPIHHTQGKQSCTCQCHQARGSEVKEYITLAHYPKEDESVEVKSKSQIRRIAIEKELK